jgi:GPN-loop GTPase
MFGQLVIGPPASGKSTYCESLAQVFTHMNRSCVILNLDPAADPPKESEYRLSQIESNL